MILEFSSLNKRHSATNVPFHAETPPRTQPGRKLNTSVRVSCFIQHFIFKAPFPYLCFYTYETRRQLRAWSHQFNWLICRLKDLEGLLKRGETRAPVIRRLL